MGVCSLGEMFSFRPHNVMPYSRQIPWGKIFMDQKNFSLMVLNSWFTMERNYNFKKMATSFEVEMSHDKIT